MKDKKLIFIAAGLISVVLILFILIRVKNPGSSLSNKEAAAVSAAGNDSLAAELKAKGNLAQAKTEYQRLINDMPSSAAIADWQKAVENINISLLFSPEITAGSVLYEIKPGDSLTKIAKEYGTTIELLMKSNNLSGDKIYPGKKLKAWTQPFSVFADKSQNMLILKSNEEIIKTYVIATGKNNSTPVGTFKIVNKLKDPTWYNKEKGAVYPSSSPENILGSRWMGFDLADYGIHGTTDPQSLGLQVTQGCIRMSNADVEELYTIIPVGTEVIITD